MYKRQVNTGRRYRQSYGNSSRRGDWTRRRGGLGLGSHCIFLGNPPATTRTGDGGCGNSLFVEDLARGWTRRTLSLIHI